MNKCFYPRIALDGIRKNKRLYLPYILIGSITVTTYYVLSFLISSPALEKMSGGSVLMTMLPLGCAVIAIFSVLFLFYTNSFLIKQRFREFGLYSILGMNKRNICRVMAWESLFSSLLSIAAGLATGIALSKAAELVLLKLLDMEVSFGLSVGLSALGETCLVYAAIYLLLLVNSIIRILRSRPLELMQSSRAGEKFLKRTWIFATLGLLSLGTAYYLAVRIEEPATALFVFFVAVVLVIFGTYLLFVSGSVALCRALQKNKTYYYTPKHFVSVSSMLYRMKRNGAGLATICILLTMVLVMLSSTATLYFGEEDSLKNRYPNDVNVKVYFDSLDGISDNALNDLREAVSNAIGTKHDLSGRRMCAVAGMFTDSGIILDYTHADYVSYDDLGYLYAVPLDDYNRSMNESKTLADGECLIYSSRCSVQWTDFTAEYGDTYTVKERLTEFYEDRDSLAMTMPSVYIVVNDLDAFTAPLGDIKTQNGNVMLEYVWSCGFDIANAEEELAARDNAYDAIKLFGDNGELIRSFYVESREQQKAGFFELYGSLFFLGIMLSLVFILAAVMIIYYKQLSEGYEDQSRFEIMQKIGMTKKDIRKSINSQMLTVFFAPLLMAGIHLAFAYPFVSKILLLFAFDNTPLNISVNVLCFVCFGIFYTFVYKITSGVYCGIVSGGANKRL